MGRVFGRFEGRCRLTSFCRSIHSRWGCVKNALPVLDVKLPMMILKRMSAHFLEDEVVSSAYLTNNVRMTTAPKRL